MTITEIRRGINHSNSQISETRKQTTAPIYHSESEFQRLSTYAGSSAHMISKLLHGSAINLNSRPRIKLEETRLSGCIIITVIQLIIELMIRTLLAAPSYHSKWSTI